MSNEEFIKEKVREFEELARYIENAGSERQTLINFKKEVKSFLSQSLTAAIEQGRNEARKKHQKDCPFLSIKEAVDLLEEAWGIISNVSGGNWDLQNKEWVDATIRFRTKYFGTSTGG